jgi:hypothetical protein
MDGWKREERMSCGIKIKEKVVVVEAELEEVFLFEFYSCYVLSHKENRKSFLSSPANLRDLEVICVRNRRTIHWQACTDFYKHFILKFLIFLFIYKI